MQCADGVRINPTVNKIPEVSATHANVLSVAFMQLLCDTRQSQTAVTGTFIYFAHYRCSNFSPTGFFVTIEGSLSSSRCLRRLTGFSFFPTDICTCTYTVFSLVLSPTLLRQPHPFIFPLPLFPVKERVSCIALNTHVFPRLTASGMGGGGHGGVHLMKEERRGVHGV